MAPSEYRLKAVAVYAEQVPADLPSILALAIAWGAEVRVHPDTGITLRLQTFAVGAVSTASPGDWLLDKGAGDRGCCTNEEFVASFESVP